MNRHNATRRDRAPLAIALAGAVALAWGAGSYFANPPTEAALEAPTGPLADNPARLAGYGCNGATGTLYGREESDFPACVAIVPVGARTFTLVRTHIATRSESVPDFALSLDDCTRLAWDSDGYGDGFSYSCELESPEALTGLAQRARLAQAMGVEQ